MRVVLFTFLFFILTANLLAQQKLNTSLELGSERTQVYFFSANEKDKIQVNIKKTKGEKITSLYLEDFLNKVILFKDEDTKKFSKKIKVQSRSIYKLSITNAAPNAIELAIKYNINSKKAAPTIAYKTVKDTAYSQPVKTTVNEDGLKTVPVQQDKFYLNSRSNALVKGGKNRVLLPIHLPENTVSWHYVFTASRDETAINNTIQSFGLASELTTYINKGESIASGLRSLNPPPGANICDVYLLDEENARLFKEKEDFESFLDSSRENYKSGIVTVKRVSENTMYLGLNNPDNIYGIHLGLEIVAVVKTDKTTEKIIRKPIITTKKVPYLVE